MTLDAPNLNHLWAGLVVEELVRSGVVCFCIAPGSRSTPLTTAVARHPAARAVVHYDERGTAFAALGYGRATRRPAAWITTSGTAVANGLPAVVEASADGVPLLLLTADRPPELRSTGANQAIDQVKIFGSYTRWFFDLPAPTTDVPLEAVLTTVDQAVRRATGVPAGPVHLNCMFRKPLAPQPDGRDYGAYTARLDGWQRQKEPYTRYAKAVPEADRTEVERLDEMLRSTERGLVVAGRLDTASEAAAVARLARRLGWPLLPDVTSQLRLGPAFGAARIAHYDQLLAGAPFREAHRAEAVLHVGGRFISKSLQQYLARCHPRSYVVVHADPTRLDPGHRVTQRVESDVAAFCDALAERWQAAPPQKSAWTAAWQAADEHARACFEAFAGESEELSEPLVARLVARHLPAGCGLCLASSMPVRDMDRYASPDAHPALVLANRGASGIDGTVATAAGAACGLEGPVALLTGDLALLHDLNALALLRGLPVVVVVLNNDGGGIFHFLPIAQHEDVFEPYFATPHGRSFEAAAALFGLDYQRPASKTAFVAAYRAACASGRPALIEVQTRRAENRVVHRRLDERIARAV